jgi:prepilin-type N-terminal cleavage/methylation domain-containing protein
MNYSTMPMRRRAFTLVELVTVIALVGVLTMVVGTLLVSSHKHWNALYGRVYRQEATDAFAAHRMFDAVCRKSSYRKAVVGSNNESLELYYWDDGSVSETPENYARFYLSGNDLKVEHGATKPGTWTPDSARPVQSLLAASNVQRAEFEVRGASVQMILYYRDSSLKPSICSAIRQNF